MILELMIQSHQIGRTFRADRNLQALLEIVLRAGIIQLVPADEVQSVTLILEQKADVVSYRHLIFGKFHNDSSSCKIKTIRYNIYYSIFSVKIQVFTRVRSILQCCTNNSCIIFICCSYNFWWFTLIKSIFWIYYFCY